MDRLYAYEMYFLHALQTNALFREPLATKFWLACTKLGDPAWVFYYYFPVLHALLGAQNSLRFLICGSITEFINGVLKWILFGHRPFWITELFSDKSVETPFLEQFQYTCETGPGSPSGHVMVTSAVWLLCIRLVLKKQTGPRRTLIESFSYLLYVCCIILVAVSRLFIAAHFPHQVLFGFLAGLAFALLCERIPAKLLHLRPLVYLACVLILSAAVVYLGLILFNFDPNWSISFAVKWCKDPNWVHVSTTPLAALFRDIAALVGAGFVAKIASDNGKANNQKDGHATGCRRLLESAFSLFIVTAFRFIPLPSTILLVYYIAIFVQMLLIVFVVTRAVPHWVDQLFVFLSPSAGRTQANSLKLKR